MSWIRFPRLFFASLFAPDSLRRSIRDRRPVLVQRDQGETATVEVDTFPLNGVTVNLYDTTGQVRYMSTNDMHFRTKINMPAEEGHTLRLRHA